MFSGCSSLVTIPELDFSSAREVICMFQNCSSLVTIPELNTTNVTNMTEVFDGCYSLITIPELNTTNVTSFSSMFQNCSSLITIPELNTTNVTSFSSMFSGCSSLVTIPELDFSNATSIGEIFRNTTSLEVLPQLNLQLLTTSSLDIGKSFKYIKGINAPLITGFDSSFFRNSVYIGRLDCPKVSKYSFSSKDLLKIEYIDTTSLADCSNMFSGCSSLTTIPELNTSNCTNFSYMFRDCKSLTTIPELNTTNGTDFKYMFQNCSSLTTIPELNTTNGTNFSYMFSGCSSLVTIPDIDTSNGTNFSYIFRECESVTTVPLLNTIKGADMTGMFYDCSSLITIPELNFSSATKINYFINNCPRLEIVPSIYLTNPNLTSISNLICGTSNIKKFGDLIFPYITYTSSLFYQNSFDKCSEVGTFDLSSYPFGSDTVNIPANPELIKKVKIVGGALKRQIDFSSSYNPNYVRDYEVDAIDCNMNLNYWVALTKQSLLNILNALVPQEGTTRTLTLNKTYHIPLLTDEEIAIATNKGWTISEGTYTLSS